MKELGNKLRMKRELKRISQKELGYALSLHQSIISAYENNRKRPSYEILIAIAKYFDVTIDYLLGTEEI